MDGPAELPLHKKKPAAKPAAKQMRRPSLRKSGSLQSKGRQSTSDAKLIDLDEDDDGIVSDGPDDGDDDAASDVFKPEDIESSSEDDEASVHGTDEDVDTEADEASDEDHALEARSRKSEKGQKRPERSSKGGRKPAKRPRIAMSEDDEGDGDDEELIMSKAKAPAKSKTPGAANKKAYTDTWKYKPGLAEELPPISDVSEIADDMTRKALANGFQKVLDHIGSRKLRVATMCSGTESPILAIQLISDSKLRDDLPLLFHLADADYLFFTGLKKLFGQDFEYDHLFSAEIVPFKQAYIERNFQPPIMFRDIKELLAGDKA